MKDATNGDTPRGAVSTQRSVDFRMGKPSNGNALLTLAEYIGWRSTTQGIETS